MSYLSPPTSPPPANIPNFRLPPKPTILLKEPTEDTVIRLRQLAPYYWSHPQTTNCAIHFPIDVRQHNRVLEYQSRVRINQQRIKAAQAAGINLAHVNTLNVPVPASVPRRGSVQHGPLHKAASAHRLRSAQSSNSLSSTNARAAILGSSPNEHAPSRKSPEANGRRGSLTPGYDPFSNGSASVVPTNGTHAPYSRRESAPTNRPVVNTTPYHHQPVDYVAAARRGSAPPFIDPSKGTPMRTVRLHVEYLSAHSALFRQVLTKAVGFPSPTDASRCSPPSPTSSLGESQPSTNQGSIPNSLPTPPLDATQSIPSPPTDPENLFPHSFFRFAPHRYPKVIPPPTQQNNPHGNPIVGPTIILPVPDPVSFPLLIHFMYFGKIDNIERVLREGQASWEGLVRNVEYLGLRDDVKQYLGRWWKKWRSDSGRGAGQEDEDDNETTSFGGYGAGMDMDMEDDMQSEPTVNMNWNGAPTGEADELSGLLDRF